MSRLFANPWTIAYLVPPSMGFSRQEYWSGLPFPSPRDLPNPGIKFVSLALQADSLLPNSAISRNGTVPSANVNGSRDCYIE